MTSCNGLNYIGFLTTKYNESFIKTYNLGYGGATIDQAIVGSAFGPFVRSFWDQVNNVFHPTYAGNMTGTFRWKSNDSLFIIFFGINDAVNTYNRPNNDALGYAQIKSYENLVNQVSSNFLGATHVKANGGDSCILTAPETSYS